MDKNNIHSQIKISFDNDFISTLYDITPAQNKLLKEIAIRLHGKIDKVLLRKIEKLSKANPSLPQLKNYLSIAYKELGNNQKAFEINNQLLKEFPNYLHAQLNAANYHIYMGEPDEALHYLGENLDLKELFPKRNEFHFSEVQSYYFITVLYAIAKKDLPLAENRFEIYKAIDLENPGIEDLEDRLTHLRIYLEYENDEDDYSELSGTIEITPPTNNKTEAPVFHHPEIHQLYQLGFKKAKPVFEVLLALPRTSLIQDLELVLQDGIDRYAYFTNKEWSVYTHSFPLHALFLLMELKATESLTTVLEFLQYEDAFLELYIGDFLTEELWQCLYILGENKVPVLNEFILRPGIHSYTKGAVSKALSQIATLDSSRKKEITSVYEQLLHFFINAKDEDNVIDPTFLGIMIGDIADAKMSSLFPYVEKLYDLDYIDYSFEGDYDNFLDNFSQTSLMLNNEPIMTLAEIYSTAQYCEESEPINKKKILKKEYKTTQTPISTVKTNRNDPCPCGSGKKFKKCCG